MAVFRVIPTEESSFTLSSPPNDCSEGGHVQLPRFVVKAICEYCKGLSN